MATETPKAPTAQTSESAGTKKKKTSAKKKTAAAAPRSSKLRIRPLSEGMTEVTVTILAKANAAFEAEAKAENAAAKEGGVAVDASDVLSALIDSMGAGPKIDLEAEKTVQATFRIPVADKRKLVAAAEQRKVSVDRLIQEIGLNLR